MITTFQKMSTENEYVFRRFMEILTPHKVDLFKQIASNRTRHLCVVLEDIFQEHNASAIIRTSDCLGIQDLYTIEEKNKYVLQRKIALGAGRWINLHRFGQQKNPADNCLSELKSKGYKIVATSPHSDAFTPNNLPIEQPLAIVFGTERHGLSEKILQQADYHLAIPMYGFTESLNLSVSAAIILQSIRTRLEQSQLPWKISSEAQTKLIIEWSTHILNGGKALEKQFRTEYFQKEL